MKPRINILWAASEGKEKCVQLLIEIGANEEAKDEVGKTALMCAAKWGRGSCVELLIKNGANKEAKNKNGQTALDLAKERSEERTIWIVTIMKDYERCVQLLSIN